MLANPSPTLPALVVDKVSMQFTGLRALKEISLRVPSGQRLAIIGPNGAGKTTLLNIIGGQVAPSSGHVHVFDQEITRRRVHERAHVGVARSFQTSSSFPDFSVLDNAWLAIGGCKSWRWSALHQASHYRDAIDTADALLREWNLIDHRDALASTLSHGDRRKLETVMTLASAPRLLLLDEPSAGLTVAESHAITDHLRSLNRETTAVVVAHDMDLVFGVAERIVVLHHGEIIADGTPEDVRADVRVREVYMGQAVTDART